MPDSKGFSAWAERLFERHKLVRRVALFWAIWLITVVILRVTEPNVILGISAAGATIVTGVIGILATVIGFYQWYRQHEEDK